MMACVDMSIDGRHMRRYRHTPTYDTFTTLFNYHHATELEALASQLRHLIDMTLLLASASTIWHRCRQFAYKHISLCVSVIK